MIEPSEATFSARLRGPDLLRIGVVFGALVALVVSATIVSGAAPRSPAANGAAANALSAQTTTGSVDTQTVDGWQRITAASNDSGNAMPMFGNGRLDADGNMPGMPGMKGPGGMRGPGGPFGQITISSISGSDLTLKTDDGWTRTITVSSSTTITRGGQTIALTDLKVGDAIRFSQTRNTDGTFAINAIVVVVPEVEGTVASVDANGFTVTARDGTTWTVTVNSSTTYTAGKDAGSKSDVTTGATVVVEGSTTSANAITATTVRVQLPVVVGQVTAKTSSSITLQTVGGGTATVHVGSATTYRAAGKASATLDDVAVGSMVVAQGTRRSDGSIDASVVMTGGFGKGPGAEGRGFGHAFGGGPWSRGGPAPTATPSGQGTSG